MCVIDCMCREAGTGMAVGRNGVKESVGYLYLKGGGAVQADIIG